jgi:hypothetical protein
MMCRVGVSVLALACLTAFAPAPFPRPDRRGGADGEVSLDALQGEWHAVWMSARSDGLARQVHWRFIDGRTQRDGYWAFYCLLQHPGPRVETVARFMIRINPNAKPATADFYLLKGVMPFGDGPGIIRRLKAGRLEIVHATESEGQRPVRFDRLADGQNVLSLQRVR